MDFLRIVSSNIPATMSVTYSCVLSNKWSNATHPVDYPSIAGSAHWTDPVLVAHSGNYEVWSPTTFATPGVEAVAEGGITGILQDEICLAQYKGLAGEMVIGRNQFNRGDPPQVFETISLTPNFPYLSTITMAGPSPDWFTGFYNVLPVDAQQFWYESFEIETYPWDAGTETGETYSISNLPEDPHVPIFRLTKDTVPASGILLDPTGTEVLPVASWSCAIDSANPGIRNLVEEGSGKAALRGARN